MSPEHRAAPTPSDRASRGANLKSVCRAEHLERPRRQAFVRRLSPVDGLDVAALRARWVPPSAVGTPRAVVSPPRLDEVERVGRSGIGETDRPRQRYEADEDVVMPVRWKAKLAHGRMRRLAGAMRLEDVVHEQKLGGTLRCSTSLRVSRVSRVRREAHRRSPRLVE